MSNWAIVIGIDHYPASETWNLNGAVRDALKMRSWLLDPRGGAVPPENFRLLLSPHAPLADTEIKYSDPTYVAIVKAIDLALDAGAEAAGRFYFYFAGHGLSARLDFVNKSAIVARDFSEDVPTLSLTVLSLFEVFLSTRFAEQYFFIDACRNMPFDEVRLGDFPRPRRPVTPAGAQFVMYATQPGVKAREVGKPGDENGAFTEVLLEGLNGSGAAKAWDPDSDEYVVRWQRLFAMVESTVKKRKLLADARPGGPLIQIPKQFGERGSADPELGRFAKDMYQMERLSINLEPAQRVQTLAQLRVNEMVGTAADRSPPYPVLPISIELPPRAYSVVGRALGYRSKKPAITVELYEPCQVTVEFIEEPPGPDHSKGMADSPSIRGLSRRSVVPEDGQTFGIVNEGWPQPESTQETGLLRCESIDPLAFLQTTDESGKLIAMKRGQIFESNLPLNRFYRMQMLSPEGEVVAQALERPDSNYTRLIRLSYATVFSPAMQQVIAASGMSVDSDGVATPSAAVGPVEFLKLSTALALAAAAKLENLTAANDTGLRKLPIIDFPADVKGRGSGIYIVLGDELAEEQWESLVVGYLRPGAPAKEFKSFAIQRGMLDDGLSIMSIASALRPGRYNIAVCLQSSIVAVSTILMAGRATILCVTKERDRTLEVHTYLMPLPTSQGVEAVPAWQARDPYFSGASFPAIRRIEYMQRSFAKGRVMPLEPDIDLLLEDKWMDPIAGCLGGYCAVRIGRQLRLNVATGNLVKYFGSLPDVHVLRGCYLEATGAVKEAIASYQRSLGGGVPLFREGLSILVDAAKRLHIKFDKIDPASILDRLASGTAWVAIETPFSLGANVDIGIALRALEIEGDPAIETPLSLDANVEIEIAPRALEIEGGPATEEEKPAESEEHQFMAGH